MKSLKCFCHNFTRGAVPAEQGRGSAGVELQGPTANAVVSFA